MRALLQLLLILFFQIATITFVLPSSIAQDNPIDAIVADFGGLTHFEANVGKNAMWAPEPSFPTASYILNCKTAFTRDLKLSKDQLKQLEELTIQWNKSAYADAKSHFGDVVYGKVIIGKWDINPEETKKVVEFAEKITVDHEQRLKAIVNAAQLLRAKQLRLQAMEATIFTNELVSAFLQLSSDQSEKIKAIIKQNPLPEPLPFRESFGAASKQTDAKADALKRKNYAKKVESVSQMRFKLAMKELSKDQLAKLEELIGPIK